MLVTTRFSFSYVFLFLGLAGVVSAALTHRQSDYTVQVNNLAGAPVEGAIVSIEMLNHDFRFGTAMVAGELSPGSADFSAQGLAAAQQYFNSMTFGNYMKWTYVEGRSGAETLSTIQDAMALNPFNSDERFRVRGHVTVWGAQYQLPADLQAMTDPAAVQARIRNHVTDYHTLFKDSGVEVFDLYNEHFHEREFVIEKAVLNGTTQSEAAEVAEWFKAAQLADPSAVLYMNEYNILNFWQENDADVIAYKEFVDAVRDAGGPVAGIGLQAHMDRMISKAQITRRLDILGAPMAPTTNYPDGLPGLRLEVTELDINTQQWSSATPADQAQVTANVMDGAFEHPAVDGITIWGMRDSIHWRDNAILFDDSDANNWVIKPSGQEWIDRVTDAWWSSLSGQTGSLGDFSATVFKGQYRITVTHNGNSQEFVRRITTDGALTVQMDDTPLDTSGSYLSNLSVRAPIGEGETLKLGFVVAGGAKDLLVRVAGPALADFAVADAMVDPRFDVVQSEVVQVSNDDWEDSIAGTATALGAFPFTSGSTDAGVVASLQNPNTVEITGTAAGTVLGEVYDASAGPTGPRLTNVSANHFVGTGDDVLIAGFAVGGTGRGRVLIRGVGPELAELGVAGTLVDPQIQVFNSSNEVVAANNDWGSELTATMAELGAFALTPGSKDAALVVVLNVGERYTVQLSGADGGIGQGIIEVYEYR